ncbi:MAG: hypothetical protein WCG95_08180 [bacterium]
MSKQQGLSNQVAEWPTIRAQEPASTTKGYGRGLAELVEGKEQSVGPRARGNRNTHGKRPELLPHATKAQLNPRWVESLMGLPLGWTQPSALIQEQTNFDCSATE